MVKKLMDKKAKYKLLAGLVLAGVVLLGFAIAAPSNRPAAQCRDGIDNDGDTFSDYPNDPGCSSKNDNNELGTAVCDNGLDNDGDGQIDYPDDPGCSSPADASEYGAVECDDPTDNDGDGKNNLADAGCASLMDNDETNCGDGVCEGGETSVTCTADCGFADSCSDTDGVNPFVLGTVSGYLNNLQYSNSDYCQDSSNVVENYCSGNYASSQAQSCGADSFSDDYCVGNLIYKNFTDYGCGSGKCSYTTSQVFVESCTVGCFQGACMPNSDSCSDTDGVNPFVLGTVSGYENNAQYSSNDFCADAENVNEYYCSGTSRQSQIISCGVDSYTPNYCINNSVYRDFIDSGCNSACSYVQVPQLVDLCLFGCTLGQCNPAPDSCFDTDADLEGGLRFMNPGNVTGYYNNLFYVEVDTCLDSQTLIEKGCQGTIPVNETLFTCSWLGNTTGMCSSGACI